MKRDAFGKRFVDSLLKFWIDKLGNPKTQM
jgi:hypothetical protein